MMSFNIEDCKNYVHTYIFATYLTGQKPERKNMTECMIRFDGSNFEFNGRKFESEDECLDYIKSIEDEGERVRAAMQRRPLREGDRIERRTEVVGEETFFVSKVIRVDCRIEVWMKYCEDSDYTNESMTHEGYALVASFVLSESEPLLPMSFDEPIFS